MNVYGASVQVLEGHSRQGERIHEIVQCQTAYETESESQLCGGMFVVEELKESWIQPDVDLQLTSHMIARLQVNGVLNIFLGYTTLIQVCCFCCPQAVVSFISWYACHIAHPFHFLIECVFTYRCHTVSRSRTVLWNFIKRTDIKKYHSLQLLVATC